ncbi:MAG: lipoyl(octanoyl) transferase LipB [Planctomycetota bacterium]|nr:lipoyl(octanoyl) transferase LipB [Planctomycetota bacterium]
MAALPPPPAREARLLLLEHRPVYTLGRLTAPAHLILPEADLARGAEVVQASRGGSVTYHGPGQLTAYLILNLKAWDLAIHRHLWNLEEIAIRTLAAFGLGGLRVEGMTGVWVEEFRVPGSEFRGATSERESPLPLRERAGGGLSEKLLSPSEPGTWNSELAKVCAIGVGCRRWITFHGLSLNVDLNLAPFERIDPCGLGRKPVTSLARLLGRAVTIDEAAEAMTKACAEVLDAEPSLNPQSRIRNPQ